MRRATAQRGSVKAHGTPQKQPAHDRGDDERPISRQLPATPRRARRQVPVRFADGSGLASVVARARARPTAGNATDALPRCNRGPPASRRHCHLVCVLSCHVEPLGYRSRQNRAREGEIVSRFEKSSQSLRQSQSVAWTHRSPGAQVPAEAERLLLLAVARGPARENGRDRVVRSLARAQLVGRA